MTVNQKLEVELNTHREITKTVHALVTEHEQDPQSVVNAIKNMTSDQHLKHQIDKEIRAAINHDQGLTRLLAAVRGSGMRPEEDLKKMRAASQAKCTDIVQTLKSIALDEHMSDAVKLEMYIQIAGTAKMQMAKAEMKAIND